MRDATGRVIVPYRFGSIYPTSSQGAVIHDQRKGWSSYTVGKGETFITPEQASRVRAYDDYGECNAVSSGGPSSLYLVFYDRERGMSDLMIFYGSEDAVTIRGANLPRRVYRTLIVPVTAPDKTIAAQIYDLHGRPMSGTIGAISYWHLNKTPYGTCALGSPDMLSVGPSLDPGTGVTNAGNLYFPLNRDGTFYPMPEGAIGILPLRGTVENVDHTYANDNGMEYFNDVWGLVYTDAQGWSFSLHPGKPLDAVSGAAGKEPRYRNLVRDYSGMFAAQDVRDGSWKVFSSGAPQPMNLAVRYANGRAVLAGVKSMLETERAQREADTARALALAADREQYHRFLALPNRGNLCQHSPPLRLTIEDVAGHARACPGSFTVEDLAKAQQLGLSADLIASVRMAWRMQDAAANLARIQREEALRKPPPYVPSSFDAAVRAGGDAFIKNLNQQTDNWFEQRKRAYREEWQRKQRAY